MKINYLNKSDNSESGEDDDISDITAGDTIKPNLK